MATLGYIKDRKRWRVRWRAKCRGNPHVFAGSKVFLEKAQAVRFYADIENQERLWRSGEVNVNESVFEIKDLFLKHCKKFTQRTQGHYAFVINRFVTSLPDNVLRVQQIDPGHIREYLYTIKNKKGKDAKNRTRNAHLTAIKSFCRWCSSQYKLPNPANSIQLLTEEPPNSRFLTPEELKKVLAVADEVAKNRILFLANTGLRASEFASLSIDSVCSQAHTITITGKGRRRRTIPLNSVCLRILPHLQVCSPNALYLQFSRSFGEGQ